MHRYVVVAGVALWLTLGCLLSGCANQGKKIDQVFGGLPTPPDAELVHEQGGTRQGSEDACFFTYKQYLYGTNQGFEQIVEFYSQTMDMEPWNRDSGPFAGPLSWERNNREFRMSIGPNPSSLEFPEKVVTETKESYKTVYYITIIYADRLARECLE